VTEVQPTNVTPLQVRDPTAADLIGLLEHHDTHHYGIPDERHVRLDWTRARGLELVPVSQDLVPGDVYVFPYIALADALDGTRLPADRVAKAALKIAAKVRDTPILEALGYVPAAWTVPPERYFDVPFPAHTRVTVSGVFGTVASPVEEWSFSVKTEARPDPQDQAALNTAATTALTAYGTTLAGVQTGKIVATTVKYARIDGTGHVAKFPDGSYQQGIAHGEIAGKTSEASPRNLPLQTALVISLGTARVGPSGKGRFFLPFQMSSAIGDDFRISEGTANGFAAQATAWLRAVNGILGPVVVVSSKGFVSPVTGVRVGRVLDTMRSRRESIDEGYVSRPITV
jgi:hypothetical protein